VKDRTPARISLEVSWDPLPQVLEGTDQELMTVKSRKRICFCVAAAGLTLFLMAYADLHFAT
jgi:hypothetical protein